MKFDSSYDRDKARRLVANLQTRKNTAVLMNKEPVRNAVALPTGGMPNLDVNDPGVYRQDVINGLLDWLLSTEGMARVMLVDQRGLVVADRGETGDWDMESLACHMIEALGLLSRVREGGHSPDMLLWQSGDWWPAAVVLPLEPEPLVLGVVSSVTLTPESLSFFRRRLYERMLETP
ncbi:hypothetical protein [Acanthopleuribacter pedis]|uniref:Uncharacterized protein n=1 Tax=Acanthopleuribacter pedis TaxID=442870 RepID=A0A8J7QDW7_9BACT|nr:hypothetical protein [Acanthopleuribacter pedis]MBO1322767.1 hypothetical protein [Acanthopleuribacter pedis]